MGEKIHSFPGIACPAKTSNFFRVLTFGPIRRPDRPAGSTVLSDFWNGRTKNDPFPKNCKRWVPPTQTTQPTTSSAISKLSRKHNEKCLSRGKPGKKMHTKKLQKNAIFEKSAKNVKILREKAKKIKKSAYPQACKRHPNFKATMWKYKEKRKTKILKQNTERVKKV